MTREELLTCQLAHNKAGNGYACVQFDPEGDSRYVRVMSATIPHKDRQAWLAALSCLEVYKISPGLDPDKKPYPPEPVKLDEDQLRHLKEFRDGLADGTLKCVHTKIVPAYKSKPAALV